MTHEEKLTAYALGELSPEEAQAFEKELESNSKLKTELSEFSAFTTELKNSLKQEPPLHLTEEQKSEFLDPIPTPKPAPIPRSAYYWMVGAVAAMLYMTVSLMLIEQHRLPLDLAIEEPKAKPQTEHLTIFDDIPEPPIENETAPQAPVGALSMESGSEDITEEIVADSPAPDLRPELSSPIDSGVLYSTPMANIPGGGGMGGSLSRTHRSLSGFGGRQVESTTESYSPIAEHGFLKPNPHRLSTFAIDIDTASYANVRRFINSGELPPIDAIRIEELINYFDYDYPQPKGNAPFSVNMEVATAPWNQEHQLVRIGLQGKRFGRNQRPAANLVFLIDVSGSMSDPNKLPLVKASLKLLTNELRKDDRIALVVYSGNAGVVLPPTPISEKEAIHAALNRLEAGGSTDGSSGIQLAYKVAQDAFLKKGINRVILATDGDFNMGITGRNALKEFIQEKAQSRVFLSVFGFGMGNLKDGTLEMLANKGNGHYGYIDTEKEARRIFVDKLGATLQTVAKDVKIQVDFNPALVSAYRLIGYENRVMPSKDFRDDEKDAGEIGAGHQVTALYEIIPHRKLNGSSVASKYHFPESREIHADEILELRLRYKKPKGATASELKFPLKTKRDILDYRRASKNFQLAAAAASFGMLLRNSPHRGAANWDTVSALIEKSRKRGADDRKEFQELVTKVRDL